MNKRKWRLNLQWHTDGGPGGAGGAEVSTGGNAVDAGQNAIGQVEGQDAAVQTKASFDELLRDPDYKRAYDERVSKAIQGRFKSAEADRQRLASANRVFEIFGSRYGINPGEDGNYDVDALRKAVEDDDSFFEAEASERGLSVAELKHIKKLERDNAEFIRREKEAKKKEQEQQLFSSVVAGAEATKRIYPSFDLDAEMQNPQFARMVMGAGVPVQTAFEVVHKDEIIPAAMQYTAKKTAEQTAQTIAAGKARPVENGAGAGVATDSRLDPGSLTKEQWRQLVDRARRGEKISF